MKFFWVKENKVEWAKLNVSAYSNRFGAFVDTTNIPEYKTLKVVLTDSFNTENGEFTPTLSDNLKIAQRAVKRSFILFKGETPVGWATFHRNHNYVPKVETEDLPDVTDEPDVIDIPVTIEE